MKNVYEILSGLGIELPEDKKSEFDKDFAENYKTISDYEKQTGKVTELSGQLKTATDGLKAFEGVDINDLKKQISKLQGDLATKDTEYQTKLADMEFDSLVTGAVSAAKGRNAKAIRALLDVDALKASKNQETDIKAAIETLQKDNGYLFDTEEAPPPYAAGTGTKPTGSTKCTPEENAIRAAAGLKAE